MWFTVLLMAIAVSMEPFRLGMTVLMLNRPRPVLQLLALLSGGLAMGTAVGLFALFAIGPRFVGSSELTLPKVQIVIGVVALLVAAVLSTRVLSKRFERRELPTWARHLLNGRSLWAAGVAGSGMALPSVDYLAALAVIVVSGVAPMAQVGALLMFNLVAFAVVEVPLVAYLLAPVRTRALMTSLHDWIRSRRRRQVAALLAGVGCVLLLVGIIGL